MKEEMRRMRVGVFDSGIGGLTVLRDCVRIAPECDYLYFGDNEHAPYGSRSSVEITSFVRAAIDLFCGEGADAVVLACNTATAVCAEEMRREFKIPIIGMEPAVKSAGKVCKHALVLATPRTAESRRLKVLIERSPECRFTVCAADGLAGAIECHFTKNQPLTLFDHLPRGEFDGVVLGCTHYIFFREEISRFYGVPVFDGNVGTAKRLFSVLSDGAKSKNLGTADHLQPPYKANNCLTKIRKKGGFGEIFFLGNGRNLNKSVYKTNICFRKK